MHIVFNDRLKDLQEKHSDSTRGRLEAWYNMMKLRDYENPHEVQQNFPHVSFSGDGWTVFNIRGNKYRLVARFRYDIRAVTIHSVLTHAEYTRRTNAGTL